MLTNNSILVQLYYYSSSTSHIQAISLRAYSHVLIVHHTYGRAKAERVYLVAYALVPTYRGRVSGNSLPHMPPPVSEWAPRHFGQILMFHRNRTTLELTAQISNHMRSAIRWFLEPGIQIKVSTFLHFQRLHRPVVEPGQ